MKTKYNFLATKLVASCCFLGNVPLAPGTATSIVAMLTLYSWPNIPIFTYLVALNVIFFVGAVVSEKVAIQTKIKDASFIVIDEWFGMWLALFLVPKNIFIF